MKDFSRQGVSMVPLGFVIHGLGTRMNRMTRMKSLQTLSSKSKILNPILLELAGDLVCWL